MPTYIAFGLGLFAGALFENHRPDFPVGLAFYVTAGIIFVIIDYAWELKRR